MYCGPFVPAHPASFGDMALGWEHSPSSRLLHGPQLQVVGQHHVYTSSSGI